MECWQKEGKNKLRKKRRYICGKSPTTVQENHLSHKKEGGNAEGVIDGVGEKKVEQGRKN